MEKVKDAIDALREEFKRIPTTAIRATHRIEQLSSAQPERLTDDDVETIRIHLSAFKEQLCNQHRWKEAEEYQQLIYRFMSFASAQPEPLSDIDRMKYYVCCPMCDLPKCVKGAVQCEAEQLAQARRKEGEANG